MSPETDLPGGPVLLRGGLVGGDQLPGQDEGPEPGALGLLLVSEAVGLQQPGRLQGEVNAVPVHNQTQSRILFNSDYLFSCFRIILIHLFRRILLILLTQPSSVYKFFQI